MPNQVTTFCDRMTKGSDIAFNWIVPIFIFLIPISQSFSAKMLFVATLVFFFTSKKPDTYSNIFKNAWDIVIYFFVLIIGLTYSSNTNAGLRVLETNLSFLAIPIIFSRLDEQKLKDILLYFALGLCLASFICLTNATLVYIDNGDAESFFFYKLTSILGFQPTYFAYYLIVVITYGLYLVYYQLTAIRLLMLLFVILFLFGVLMLTGGETSFISMLLVFSFFILKFIVEEKSKLKTVVISFIGLMLLYMFATTLIYRSDNNMLLNDAWDRLVVWESGLEATRDLFFGVGTGDPRSVLNEYYRAHNLYKFARESYNSHNQFIQLLFSNGFIGIAALFILLARPLYLSAKNRSLIGVLFVFPFLLYGMTEVFLGRYQGVVLFTLVHQFSILQSRSNKLTIL